MTISGNKYPYGAPVTRISSTEGAVVVGWAFGREGKDLLPLTVDGEVLLMPSVVVPPGMDAPIAHLVFHTWPDELGSVDRIHVAVPKSGIEVLIDMLSSLLEE